MTDPMTILSVALSNSVESDDCYECGAEDVTELYYSDYPDGPMICAECAGMEPEDDDPEDEYEMMLYRMGYSEYSDMDPADFYDMIGGLDE